MQHSSFIFRCALATLSLTAALTGKALASPGAHGPNGEHLDQAAAPNTSGLARLPDGSVQVPKLAQRRMGIRTVLAPEGEHAKVVTLNGRVAIDPRSGGRVQAPVAGRIDAPQEGLPLSGQAVKKGQVLAWLQPLLSAADRGTQQARLAELRANRALAEQRVARLIKLEGTVPRKDIEAAQAELRSLRDQEGAIGKALGGREAIVAPVSGVIAAGSLLAGQVVEPGALLYDIVDADRVVIEADTVDASLPAKVASAALSAHPDVKLQFVGAARALRQGSLPLTFTAKTGGTTLAIGQSVTVAVSLKDRQKGVALPADALVRNATNEPVVWIKSGAERFIAQPVQTQVLDASTVLVTKGLAPDNRVVVQGAALINQIR
jgi:cobalt-zinc-cadmium efflux system membrane fusion protein